MVEPEPPSPPESDYDTAHKVHFPEREEPAGDMSDQGGLTAARVRPLIRKTISR